MQIHQFIRLHTHCRRLESECFALQSYDEVALIWEGWFHVEEIAERAVSKAYPAKSLFVLNLLPRAW